jgi:hypothetical protein
MDLGPREGRDVICIIEHEKKGVLTEMPHERDEKPHFRWSIPRNEAKIFYSIGEARNALAALPDGCYVLKREGLGRSPEGWRKL